MRCKSSDKPKPKHRKGLWSPDEDQRLKNYVLKYGHGCWSSVPINAGLQRNGKSCRLRWINYLRPGLKRGVFSVQEEETILTLHRLLGNKWSQMAQHLPGRTDNEIKNYWHSYLKKRVLRADRENEGPNKTNSNSDNVEISSSSNATMQIPSYESLENSEKPLTDADQSVPQILDDSSNRSSLPKLMFAEWLSLDSFANNFNDSTASTASKQNASNFDYYPSFQDKFMNGCYFLNEASFGVTGSGYHTPISDGSTCDMFSPQFKFESRSPGNDQLIDFSSGEDICSDFNMSSDAMYM